MAELDFLYMGMTIGALPAFFLIAIQIKSVAKFIRKLVYGRNAVSVYQFQTNKQITHKVGKIDGNEIIIRKDRIPFNEKELGMDGRIPAAVFYPHGEQLSMSKQDTVYPLTAREYNNALMAAMIAAADSIIVKHLQQQKIFLLGTLALSGAAAFFGYNLVQTLIK